eukprot:CAMPEP_0174944902 /NCGR_PEP_ID=MMETSP1355-20121228/80237_1 /TAXON_ID=464990 /ORGANISM="Hemiselmis tepida, Strain CCMP443" /LENGTH=74 /DNA_ID=CAMNT_0016192235 /DNA_START=1 /DNA_END=221 /DNA_ORIENTATION=+
MSGRVLRSEPPSSDAFSDALVSESNSVRGSGVNAIRVRLRAGAEVAVGTSITVGGLKGTRTASGNLEVTGEGAA